MEAALTSGVLKVAGDKLGQLISSKFASIMDVPKDLSELRDLFRVITSRLSAVGDRAEIDVTWVKNLKDVAYDIEDLLNEVDMEAEKHKAGIDGDKHVTANCFCAKPKSIIFRCKMASKIKTNNERFDAIVKQISNVTAIDNILPTLDHPGQRNINSIREMSILGNVGDSTIRVRDDEKDRIIPMLVETNEQEKVLTVSIFGLGGSGKTTLANHVCDDKRIKEHFEDAIYWVHVSEEFDVLKLIGKLFETVSKKKSDFETQENMVKEISDKLSGKKFLLVLDDAWEDNRQKWEQFMRFPNRGASASRILLTTRNKRVSEAVGSTDPFGLKLLQPDDSWMFFKQCSGWTEEAMDSEFVEVGKDIVSKCGGVPLAIKTLAGVLYDERNINAWKAIRDNNLLSVQDIQDRVMGSLRLSYFHLQYDLKQCFVLCSIFPKGYMIDKEQLIDLWIAHDMILVADGVDKNNIGSKCFSSLVQKSFLQDVHQGYFNGRVTCRMHDLVHDLARFILGDEISDVVPEKTTVSRKSYRYFSLIEQTGNVPPERLFEKARAMYVANGDLIFGKPQKNAKYLRSITMERVNTESMLAVVLQIKNLRYLHMSRLKCETLPEAISNIWSLQSLHITDSRHLHEIPKSIGKLKKLRTLNLSGCVSLLCLPDSVCDCCMLSTLDLTWCGLIELPDSIGRNKKLRVLRGLEEREAVILRGPMEAALTSAVLKVAGDKLCQLISGEFASIMGVTKDLSELQDLSEEIRSWLSAVGYRVIESDPSVRWDKKLKDVAYDIEDLIYEVDMEAEKHKAGIDGDKHVTANCFYAKPKSVIFSRKMAHKIKTIKERFAAIVKQRSDFSAIVNNLPVDRPNRRNNNVIREMSILGNVGDSTIRVRDEEKERIISKLVETNEREKILTASIVGLGGSGKTTLANHICDDKRIKEHFQDAIYWVHVSEEFDVPRLIGKLFETVSKKKSDLETQQNMVKEISDKLSGKKFLLVLDDAWRENRQDWEQFMRFPNSGATGSRILLTTRNKRVSEAVKSIDTFDLKLLQLDDSWKFFLQCSGLAEGDMTYSEFIEVGKDIVSKCGGVPLAIKTLAGVLCDKGNIKAWKAIRDSNLLSVQNIQDRVLGSLRLSYFHLRDDLKQCFVLCSLFPKGYMIDKEQLIDQWIAHDMIPLADGVDDLEYIGSKCFSSLVQMSFLQEVHEGFNGRVTCRMHDLVHDLARSILGDEISNVVPEKTADARKSYRYFSLIEQIGNVTPARFFEKARAMYIANGDLKFGKPQKNAKYLRSITMDCVNTESMPAAVLQIKNLRYLYMSRLKCKTLPEAISNIWSLQSLHIRHSHLREIPKSIGKLKKLRTLNLSDCFALLSLPDSICDCCMISTLDLTHCGLIELPDSIGRNKNLRVLRLTSSNIKRLPSGITALENLECLDLQNCHGISELPEGMGNMNKLNKNLRVLRLCESQIVRLPSGITALENLECLDLQGCMQIRELPEGMENLKKLEVLNLEGCWKLCGLPEGFGQLTRLQKLGLFVVGVGERSARISELGTLGKISGQLIIDNIECMNDAGDASKACLKEKAKIRNLTLNWGSEASELIDAKEAAAVLEGLEPPSWIEHLKISGYLGVRFARWMLRQCGDVESTCCSSNCSDVGVPLGRPCHFQCLTVLRLEHFPRLKRLQGLVELPCLEELELENMKALESISWGPFPSLVSFYISYMPSLKELWTLADGEEGGRSIDHNHRCSGQVVQVQISSGGGTCFPRLSKLGIMDCDKLEAKPYLPSSLESLYLGQSNEQLLLSPSRQGQGYWSSNDVGLLPPSFGHLKELQLRGMTAVKSGSGCRWELLQHLTALESLEVSYCCQRACGASHPSDPSLSPAASLSACCPSGWGSFALYANWSSGIYQA